MMLRMVVRDCLYLNWALPVASLPEPPAPLRYQRHTWQKRDYTFVSALLFHQDAVRLTAIPRLRVHYPQLNLRLYVLDAQGQPAVLFRRMLLPLWAAACARLVTRQPAATGWLDFPRPSRDLEADSWSWRAWRGGRLAVTARLSSPSIAVGPRFNTWEEAVRYFQERPSSYVESDGALHRLETSHPPAAVWPMRADVRDASLMARLLPLQSRNGAASGELEAPAAGELPYGGAWPPYHSAFLCPELQLATSLDVVPSIASVHPAPQPVAATRVAIPALRSDRVSPAGASAPRSAPQRALGATAARMARLVRISG